MRTLTQFVRTTVIGGLIFLVPLVLLIVIVEKALSIAKPLIAPVARYFPDTPVFGITVGTLITVVVLLLLCLIAGMVARTAIGMRLSAWTESVFLSRIPLYTLYRGLIDDLARSVESLEDKKSTRAVLAQFDDGWQIGFVVEELDSGNLAVFIPGAPSPLSGSLFFLPKDRVRDSGMSVTEAAQMLRRIGVGSAKQLRGRL